METASSASSVPSPAHDADDNRPTPAELPLAEPSAVQRRGETDSPAGASAGDASAALASQATAAPSIQRDADASTATAPTLGADPISTSIGSGEGDGEESDAGAPSLAGGVGDLPLVARATTEPASDAAAEEGGARDDEVVPTLGAGALTTPVSTPVQTLSDGAGGSSSATGPGQPAASLPLAPPEGPATLHAPTSRGESSAPMASSGAGRSSSGSVIQRTLAATAGQGASAGASAAVVARTVPLLFAAPSGGGSTTSPQPSSEPMTVLRAMAPEPAPVEIQRRFDADAWSGEARTADTVSPTLAAPAVASRPTSAPSVQTSPNAPAGSRSGSALPLHTAAMAVPSSTDLLVKAGLGERGPDGSFLRSTPPEGQDAEFTVQTLPKWMKGRVNDATSAVTSAGGAASSAASAVTAGAHRMAGEVEGITAAVTGGGGGGGSMTDAQIRKLYVKLRAELDADLRRQLEAKNRYNRFRP